MSNEAIEIPPELHDDDAAAYVLAHERPDPPYVPPPPSPATQRLWAALVARARHPAVVQARRAGRAARREARKMSHQRAEQALRLREQGLNWKAIGRALGGISQTRARQLADEAARRRRSTALKDQLAEPH